MVDISHVNSDFVVTISGVRGEDFEKFSHIDDSNIGYFSFGTLSLAFFGCNIYTFCVVFDDSIFSFQSEKIENKSWSMKLEKKGYFCRIMGCAVYIVCKQIVLHYEYRLNIYNDK